MAFASHDMGQQSGPNVVPLIDVLLVLLIIFMVTVPLTTRTLSMTLKGEAAIQPIPAPEVTIRLDASDLLTINGEVVTPTELRTVLQRLQLHNSRTKYFLDIQPEVDYQSAYRLKVLLHSNDIKNFSLTNL